MASIAVVNMDGEKVGEMEVADAIFAVDVNEALLYEVVKAQLASRRAGTACSKIRAEVAGSTRKLYKQKGTGRARHGAITAPIFVGGGKAHGPRPRSYAYRPPRKMRLGALRSALALRFQQQQLVVIDAIALPEAKTRNVVSLLSKLPVRDGKRALLVDDKGNESLRRAARNLALHRCLPPEGVNVYDLLRHDYLVVSREALQALQQRCERRTKDEGQG
ncbi:MAG: 50S ribosomal protein L4 [Polyangiales bacterium]